MTQPPLNQPQEGDILVETLYAPAKKQGPVSGRLYPRTGNGRKLYVDPRDVAQRASWWRVPAEVQAEVISPAVDEVTALANAALSQTIDTNDPATMAPQWAPDAPDDEGDLPVEHEEYPASADELPSDEQMKTSAATARRRQK